VELGTLDAAFVVPADGGVAFSGPLELAYRANLESRLASRILWQVAHGAYRDEDAPLPACARRRLESPFPAPTARCGLMSPRRARR